ncbi:MAG: pyrrolo-quinoline quinone [Verrucomicrobia bacterium]|nr:pyrrolo-quinoline quinone [Verrucomicrobiota bacterium]
MKLKFCLVVLTLLQAHGVSAAVAWPQFRGPNCSGVSESDKPPVVFGPATNLLWKTAVPPGWSSPCVWNDRIFLTAFENGKLMTVGLRRSDGKKLWEQAAPAEKIEEINPVSSPASATPATDGRRVYVYFGSYGLLAYDFAGREQWRKPLPLVTLSNGSGTSPALIQGRLVINRDQEHGKSSLLAVNPRNGRTVWETPRPDFASSYATPILWKHGQDEEIVVAGSVRVVGYGIKDGQERWWTGGLEAVSVCPTPIIGDGQLFAASRSFGGNNMPPFPQMLADMDPNGDRKIARAEGKGLLGNKAIFDATDTDHDDIVTEQEWNAALAFIAKGDHGIFAVRAPGSGDLTDSHVVWKQKRGIATVPSPLFFRGRIYAVQDGGRVTCFEAKTGRILFEQERLGADGEYYASPICADGKIYFASTRGTVSVMKASDTLQVLARNDLGERLMATPAIADHKLYVRTANHLWAFGK